MMHGVNAQYSEKMWLGTSASPQAQSVELEGYSHWVSHPLTLLLPFHVSAITVLSKVRLGKNKAADLSTQISFIS